MEHQVRSEELEGTLGAQRLSRRSPQHRRPAKVVSGACHRFLIGAESLVLQQHQKRQLRRGNAGPALPRRVEDGEVTIGEQPRGRQGQLAVETARRKRKRIDVADIEQLPLRTPFPDHRLPPEPLRPHGRDSTRSPNYPQPPNCNLSLFRPRF